MKLTHIGSLPFLSVNQALDYTFKWDIPVLFTLPKLNSSEFIGHDLLNLMGIDYGSGVNFLKIDPEFKSKAKEITPFYLEPFLKKLKAHGSKKFKYQLLGPVSFYHLIQNKDLISFGEFSEFLLGKYKTLVASLAKHADLLFVLDEPFLANQTQFYTESKFIDELAKAGAEVFIHCCAKLSVEDIKSLSSIINIDLHLYSDDEISRFSPLEFPGFTWSSTDLPQNIGVLKKSTNNAQFLSPSCGLAFKSIQEVEGTINGLQFLKKSLLGQDGEIR